MLKYLPLDFEILLTLNPTTSSKIFWYFRCGCLINISHFLRTSILPRIEVISLIVSNGFSFISFIVILFWISHPKIYWSRWFFNFSSTIKSIIISQYSDQFFLLRLWLLIMLIMLIMPFLLLFAFVILDSLAWSSLIISSNISLQLPKIDSDI